MEYRAVGVTRAFADPVGLAVARLRLRARLRGAWLRHLWKDGAGGGRHVVTHGEVDAILADADSVEAEAAWHATDEGSRALAVELHEVEARLAAAGGRLRTLEQIFALEPAESDLVQACVAIAVDASLARVCAYLHDDAARAWPTEALIARLYGHERRRWLSPESALCRWDVIRVETIAPGEPEALVCDPLVRDWLLGDNRLDEALVGSAALRPPAPPLAAWPVDDVVARVSRALVHGEPVRVQIAGASGTGRRSFASAVAAGLGLPLLVIDADRVDDQAWPTVFRRAQRQAFLDRCALAWTGDALARRPWPDLPARFPLQFLIADVGQARPPAPMIDLAVELPPISIDERRGLWQLLVPGAKAWPAETVDALAARFRVPVRDIAMVGRRGVESPEAAAALVREATRSGLGELATWLECPFTADDLVVPESLRRALDELAFEARDRAAFWEQAAARRLFPQGRGLVALFTGMPGTGKTMAAQVLAATLGVDLFRISLSSVVSKYVGETSQNLQRVLSRAEHMDAVLLFDEADALFGRRTEIKDAHDRFANTDTNHLLIAIESYRGVAILASNKRANIDTAFIRRLRYVLDFPRPEAADRLRIWRGLAAELAGPERADAIAPVLRDFAAAIEMSGAQIKYALLAALFAARQEGAPLDRRHLLRGIDRELAKDGGGLSERDKQQLERHLRGEAARR
jgi:AAA+ superfamily predicted ATPase